MKLIFAIAGKAGAGKDTVASMINCIFDYFNRNTFRKDINWEDVYKQWEYFGNGDFNLFTFHFADTLKKVLANMFGLNVNHFTDRYYKDQCYYDIINRRFVTEDEYLRNNSIIEINLDTLKNMTLDHALNECAKNKKIAVIKLRTLLQYIGTEIIRNNIHKHIWTVNTINIIKTKLQNSNYCCVADMRFKEELEFLNKFAKEEKDVNIIPIIIIPNYKGYQDLNTNHSSEQTHFSDAIVIYNDATLKDLFKNIYDLTLKSIYYETD